MSDILIEISKQRGDEVSLPCMESIDAKARQSMAILSTRLDFEPYLRKGFVYSGDSGHHAISFYNLPKSNITSREAEPSYMIIGPELNLCLHEASKELKNTEKNPRTKWELYVLDEADLAKLKKHMDCTVCTREGIQFSVHRTPLTQIVETNQSQTESENRHVRLDALKRNILQRYQNTPPEPQ